VILPLAIPIPKRHWNALAGEQSMIWHACAKIALVGRKIIPTDIPIDIEP